MNQSPLDLSELFGAALQAVTAHRQEINDLDGYNGNHGDNTVENVRMIVDALKEKSSQTPAEALGYASQRLQSNGRGGTSQYYAKGLGQAADQLQGRSMLESTDVVSIVQSILGAIPSQHAPQQPQPGGGILEQILGGVGGQQPQAGGSILEQVLGGVGGQEPQAGGGILEQVLGGVGGQPPQAGGSVLEQILGSVGGQPPQAGPAGPQDDGLDLGDVLNALLPAGLAFLQARQSGADTAAAAGQALIGALMGRGHMNPLQSGTSRTAAGGLIAQSILQALAGRR
jgi:hypothetical protein